MRQVFDLGINQVNFYQIKEVGKAVDVVNVRAIQLKDSHAFVLGDWAEICNWVFRDFKPF